MAGHYEVYSTSMQLLEKHKFCTLDAFVIFINYYENYQFHAEFNCNDIRRNFQLLQMQIPFSRTTRFPENFYVHMDCANMKSLIEQFWKTLNVFNELILSRANIKFVCTFESINNLSYAEQSCNAAFTKLAAIIKSTDIIHLKENGIYCRETFEEKYGLTWINGDKNVVQYSHRRGVIL